MVWLGLALLILSVVLFFFFSDGKFLAIVAFFMSLSMIFKTEIPPVQPPVAQPPSPPKLEIVLPAESYNIPELQASLIEKEKSRTQQKEAVHSAEQKVSQLEGQLAQAKEASKFARETLSKIDKDVKDLTKRLKIGHFAHFKAKVEQEKTLTRSGKIGCNQASKKCDEIATDIALNKISEAASPIFLDAKTLTFLDKNKELRLKKQEIRKQFSADIMSKTAHCESKEGGYVVICEVTATVKGRIPAALQAEILR